MHNPNDTSTTKLNLTSLVIFILALAGIGTAGYMIIEGWSLLDAAYMVAITMATVGFGEVHELSSAGRIFTIMLIGFSWIIIYYLVRSVLEYMLENKLEHYLSHNKMEKLLHRVRDHYIVCGFGRVGRQIAAELKAEGAEFVIIERDPAKVLECERLGYLCINADATEEHALGLAGIGTAKSLIVALGTDSDAILAIVTARGLSKDIFIVARANGENTSSKLMKIGANRVVSPHQIGGFRMASFALNPIAADFLDDTADLSNKEVQIIDVVIAHGAATAGQSIATRLSSRNLGVTVLAIHKQDGNAIINPIADTIMEAGDRLILLGTRDNINSALPLINPKSSR